MDGGLMHGLMDGGVVLFHNEQVTVWTKLFNLNANSPINISNYNYG